jgi:hypothetical protein
MYIVGKYKALETGRKMSLWLAVLSCFASSANYFFIFDNVRILSSNVKKIPEQLPNCLTKCRDNRRSNRFDGVLYEVHTSVCYRFLSLYMNQVSENKYIFVNDRILTKC